MNVETTDFDGIVVFTPDTHGDSRGFFRELLRRDVFEHAAGPVEFVQENESLSRGGVVRGLHWQVPPFCQAKLVNVCRGRVLDVAVDLRPGSSTFGRYFSIILDGESGRSVFIPKGFAHGFAVLSDEALFRYKVDAPYAPDYERSCAWNSPALGIDWHISPDGIIISPKDTKAPVWTPDTTIELQ